MCPVTTRQLPEDVAEYVLACHEGDPLAAINAMIDEIEHLQAQLSLAVTAMGRGFTRGWVPPVDRQEIGQ